MSRRLRRGDMPPTGKESKSESTTFPKLYERMKAEVAKLKEELNFRKAQIAVEEEESARLRELLQVAEGALESVSRETIYTYDDGNEGPYIKLRAKDTAREALARLRPGKEEGQK